MADYESRPLGEVHPRTDQDDPGEGLRLVAETDNQTAPELLDARSKIEANLDRFSKRLLGEANRYIALIEDRQTEIGQLEAEIDSSARELGRLEAEFGRLGGLGRLTPQIVDRAEIAYHSYLVARRNSIKQLGAKSHETCPDCPDHPGLASDSVSYRDFLLYGILRLESQKPYGEGAVATTNGTTPAGRLSGSSVQTLPVAPPINKPVSQDEKQMTAYVPSHNQLEFQRLRQGEDLAQSPLLAGSGRQGPEAYVSSSFDFAAYGLGDQLGPDNPAVKQLLKSAVDHLDLTRNNQTKIAGFKTEVNKTRWSLRGLSRKIPA